MSITHNKICCPTCGRAMNKREVTLYDGMVKALASVYKWCREKNKWEGIRFKDFAHLLGPNEIQRFRDWRYFSPDMVGGSHGSFTFDMMLVARFLAGKKTVPTKILKDPFTKQIEYFEPKLIKDILPLYIFMEKDEFVVNYGGISPEPLETSKSASKPLLSHSLRERPDGSLHCTCEGYRYRKTCRHIVEHEQNLSAKLF